MKTITLKVKNMKCMGCVNTILGQLSALKGISNVSAELTSQTVTFTYETDEDLEAAKLKLSQLGYPPEK